MNEMTLPSRHRFQNSNLGGLRPSTLPLGRGRSLQSPKVQTDNTLGENARLQHEMVSAIKGIASLSEVIFLHFLSLNGQRSHADK